MTTYVLIHGGWSGAHGFRLVRRELQAAGHEVFTPSLTGIGERVHLSSPQVTLSTHVRDVVNHVLYEDLDSIILVGFSYGGFVVTGALEHIGERIRHLVYVDAFVPDHGDTPLQLTMGIDPMPVQLGEEWLVPSPEREFDDPDEGAWAAARRTPHPAGCFTESVRLLQPIEDFPFARTYIKATLDPPTDIGASAFLSAGQRAKSSPKWQYFEIETTHMVPHNRPKELSAILRECT